MYTALLLGLLSFSIWSIVRGVRRGRPGPIVAGLITGTSTVVFFASLGVWAEWLWFDAVGYPGRFITEWLAVGGMAVGAGVAGALWVAAALHAVPDRRKRTWVVPEIVAALLAIVAAPVMWENALLWWHSVDTGVTDPLLGLDVGFYLFELPFYDDLRGLGASLSIVAIIATVITVSRSEDGKSLRRDLRSKIRHIDGGARFLRVLLPIFVPVGALVFTMAAERFLATFHLLYSDFGVVSGPGWTDAHVRLPALYVVAVSLALVSLVLLVPPVSRWWMRAVGRLAPEPLSPVLFPLAMLAALPILGSVLGLGVAPGLAQWLLVEPNEITYERPYIANNIASTRRAYGFDDVEETDYSVGGAFTREVGRRNMPLLDEVRLWDWRALDAVYRQFQEIRLYYEFVDVDVDRYMIDGRYRQVMVSAREMQVDNLPANSQTFVNRRFKYTHGHGLAMSSVHEFTRDGLPRFLVKDIPPKSTLPELEVTEPRIYYGELTRTPVVVNTEEAEFDYPSGDENVYNRYEGKGGVQLSSWWRRFVFGWELDGTRLLVSSYPTSESRVLRYRNVRERLRRIAPFLRFDDDPYIVLAGGRLQWMVDAYTVSSKYPYSEPFLGAVGGGGDGASGIPRGFRGLNYIRNSVKAVVDAYDGSVALFVFDPDDPIIRVWSRVFPGLFRAREDMPADLAAHVRYPQDLLSVQGLVYAKYHMDDPEVFYNQEDLWVRATEKYYDRAVPVEPYYILWKAPGEDDVEFVLMQPFTPKKKQVLSAWIAGMCDGENYGRLLSYKFSKETRATGPQQVETKIDQEGDLSQQLTLWDQKGSRVIRGNVLAIPIEDTLLYVEPIYLEASTAAYPELRLVVVMHGDALGYGETFDEALEALWREGEAREVVERDGGVPPAIPDATTDARRVLRGDAERLEEARRAFDAYLRFLATKRFGDAARELDALDRALDAEGAGDDAEGAGDDAESGARVDEEDDGSGR